MLSNHPFTGRSINIDEPYLGGWYEPRAYVTADFGAAVVVGTHLHVGRDYGEQEARDIVGALASERRPVVLGGDLNSRLDEQPARVIVDAGFVPNESSAADIDHLLGRTTVSAGWTTLAVPYSDHEPKIGWFETP